MFYPKDLAQLPHNLYLRGFLQVQPDTKPYKFNYERLLRIDFALKLVHTERFNKSYSSLDLVDAINTLKPQRIPFFEGEIIAVLYLNRFRIMQRTVCSSSVIMNATSASIEKLILQAQDIRLNQGKLPVVEHKPLRTVAI